MDTLEKYGANKDSKQYPHRAEDRRTQVPCTKGRLTGSRKIWNRGREWKKQKSLQIEDCGGGCF